MLLKNCTVKNKLVDILVESGKISRIMPAGSTKLKEDNAIDLGKKRVIPGMIDVHTHGCQGDDTMEAEFKKLQDEWGKHGTTTVYPTTMTMDFDSIKAVNDAKTDWPGAQVPGFHMEGPYINESKKGAQNGKFVREASDEEFAKLDRMKLITIAPEFEANMEFIRKHAGDTVICVGHTAADYSTTVEAFKNGASCLTHTFNAMPPFMHRDPGPIGAAITEDAYVHVITDGLHVHKAAVLMLYRTFGPDKMVIISDSLRATGLPDGEYMFGGQPIYVNDGVCRVASGALAGSTSFLFDCVKSAYKMGIPFDDAVKMATETPAKQMGLDDRGRIEEGLNADLLVIDDELEIEKVMIKGEFYYER